MSDPSPASAPRRKDGLARLGLAAAVVAATASAGWIADDAYVPFRVVEQAHAGNGLVWNAGERVQVYTSPLWTLLLLALRGVDARLDGVAVLLGVACTAAWTAALILRAVHLRTALAVAVAAIGSRTLLEFGTSGLESPLTHLLVVAVAVSLAAGRERTAAIAAGLLLVDRLDQAVLLAPLVAGAVARGGRAALRRWALAVPAPAAWVAFATVYYGSPTPNTALAKLDDGLPWAERAGFGLRYVAESVAWDPLLGALLVGGVVAGLVRARRDPQGAAAAASIALATGWTAWIGGDFMAGRFLAAPAVLALVTLARALDDAPRPRAAWAGLAVVAAVAVAWPGHPLSADPASPPAPARVVDERAVARAMGVGDHPLRFAAAPTPVTTACAGREPLVRVTAAIGARGWEAPLDLHLVDTLALAEPLLARLPLEATSDRWRAGHVARQVPAGYLETLRSGTDRVADPGIAACWDRVRAATRDPLWSWGRAVAVARLVAVGCDDVVALHRLCDPTDPRYLPWCSTPPELEAEPRDALLAACAARHGAR